MKKVYWRPPGMSRTALVLVAVLSIAAFVAVETYPVVVKQSRYADKLRAARLALKSMEAIKAEKLRLGHPLSEADPGQTGMIGESITPVTSNTGFLDAKRTSTNPNFAAVVLHLLDQAGVGEGDRVAVGVSGSFPGLNVATYAAIAVLKARPIIVASSSSSEWGANHVDYLWVDMERTLRTQSVIPFKVEAASYGGIDDLGVGITKEGRAMIDAAIARNAIKQLSPTSLADAIEQRMAIYDEITGDDPIKAYVNVGGGSASVGTHVGKKQFKPGLNVSAPPDAKVADSVMLRFAKRDVPVIHISRVKLLAERYGLPYGPQVAVAVGQGRVFVKNEYNKGLAFGGLVLVLGAMLAFLRWDFGMRVLRGRRARADSKIPEPMV
jgi:poly-gamma-glutamate system protein